MIRFGSDRPCADPHEAAIWWAMRRQINPRRIADDRAFEEWLTEPRNAAAWAEMERRMSAVNAFATMPEIRDMRRAALETVRQRRLPRRVWPHNAAIAASLLVAVVWAISLVHGPIQSLGVAVDSSGALKPDRYITSMGERREVSLTDGSTVTLNTASAIEVRYSRDHREVRLVSGQALFQVARERSRPFVVTAGSRVITALGTAFDVKVRDDGQVSVLLVDGRVSVEPLRPRGLARLVPSLDRSELSPGQQLAANSMGEENVSFADVERETAWKRGLLIFRSDLLSNAVAEVNRYSSAQIIIRDAQINSLRVSGVFPTARPEDFLAALQRFYPIVAEQTSPATVVLRWRNAVQ